MADLPRIPPLRTIFPFPGTAGLLAFLGFVVAVIRSAVVSPKELAKAAERFTAARSGAHPAFKWDDAAVLGTHWASLAALGILALAFLTLPFWHPRHAGAPNRAPRHSPGWYRPALFGIVLLAAALRLPLACGSLWWDEAWNVKYATVGEWRQAKESADKVAFQPTSWPRAAWYYNKPANHPVLTLPSKACHLLWQRITGAAAGRFSELVLRMPVLLAGLGGLCLTACLTRRLAGERAAVIAAVIVAVHPWLIRYGVDGRSYGMAVLFMAAALVSLERATAPDTRRPTVWWWVFGLCQFLLMWAHVLSHLTVCAGLFLAATVLIHRGPSGEKRRVYAQLLVVNAVAAGLFLVAFLPNLLQAVTWGDRNDDGNLLTGSYFLRTLSQLAAGMEPGAPSGAAGGIPSLSWSGLFLVAGGGLGLAISGGLKLRRTAPRGLVILLFVVGLEALFLAAVHATGFYFYHRFILVLSLPVILLAAAGLARFSKPAVPCLALSVFVILTFPQTRLLCSRSYAPFREAIAAMRQAAGPHPPALLPVAYGLGSHVMQIYCPELRDIREEPEAALRALIAQSRRENRPLLLTWGYDGINRHNLPEGFPLIDDPTLFENVGQWSGIEPEFTFRVVRLKPALPPAAP